MTKYTVIDPRGIPLSGVTVKTGDSFIQPAHSAQVRAWLRFGQIEVSKSEESGGGAGNGPLASEAAKALAAEKGIDLTTVTGTGANGSITKPDVEAAIEAAKSGGGAGN